MQPRFEIYWKRDCTIHEVKTKTLINYAITAQMIYVFVSLLLPMQKSGFLVTRLKRIEHAGGLLNVLHVLLKYRDFNVKILVSAFVIKYSLMRLN